MLSDPVSGASRLLGNVLPCPRVAGGAPELSGASFKSLLGRDAKQRVPLYRHPDLPLAS